MHNEVASWVIAIGGLSGSGKSTLAAQIVGCFDPGHYLWVRTDQVRKRMWGVEDTEKLPQEAYTREYSQKVYEEVNRRIAEGAREGKIIIADAVFAMEIERKVVEQIAARNGAQFIGLWLHEQSVETLKNRVENRRGDVSDADSRTVDFQQSFNLGQIDWWKIDARQSREAVFESARRLLRDAGVSLCFSEKNIKSAAFKKPESPEA